ncbi:MAG: hypothetical protein NVS9B4_03190 [Candidatus Acidiferrum sp.]
MNTPQKRYEVIGTLGQGATSRVDKARDTLIGRTVAIKTFLHGFGPDLEKQFLREAQIVGGLAHPYIVALYDVGTDETGAPYFVMEYVEGRTLDPILKEGPLPLERIAVWASDLAAALSRAHRAKIIHGDIKPANILVTKDGQVKLGDFGIARFATQVSGAGSLMGTPAYLSPEQILGNTQDTRSDIFSLGIVLYQMSTGVRPFQGTSITAVCAQIISTMPPPPSHHNPVLPAIFDHIVMRCLAKDPAQRYPSADALAASLYPLTRSQPLAEATQAMPPRETFKQTVESCMVAASVRLRPVLERMSSEARTIAKSPWWNQPMQRRDRLALGAAALVAIFLIPIAHALRSRSIEALPAASSSSAKTALPAVHSLSKPLVRPQSLSSEAGIGELQDSTGRDGLSADSDRGSPNVSRTRRTGTDRPLKALVAYQASDVVTHAASPLTASNQTAPASRVAFYGPLKPAEPLQESPNFSLPSIDAMAFLRIDVISGVADQTLAVFAGEDLLLTSPLQANHIGDRLRFTCSVTPGKHDIKVVLYRPDQTVFLQKANTAEIQANGDNNMEVRVTRRSKLLLKHETLLEVAWPSIVSSVPLPKFMPRPAAALALR